MYRVKGTWYSVECRGRWLKVECTRYRVEDSVYSVGRGYNVEIRVYRVEGRGLRIQGRE